jgi:nitrile hydratase
MTETYRFSPGARVRVLELDKAGHVRTPTYLRGKMGVVETRVGHFRNPEELAYGRYDGPATALYRVRFAQKQLWPNYAGPATDTLCADLFEHWLDDQEERS